MFHHFINEIPYEVFLIFIKFRRIIFSCAAPVDAATFISK